MTSGHHNMCELSSELAVSSRLERIVQFLDEAAILANSFDSGVKLDCHDNDDDPPVFQNVVTISNLPPLDQITICSESCSDHTSLGDMSSVTTDENDEINMESTPKKELSYPKPNPSLRTIFDRYWDKNRPVQVITTTAEESKMDPVSPLHHDDDASSVNTYERTLRQSQEKTSSLPPIRRRIFQGLLPPTPDLTPPDRHCHPYPIKVQSDPCLLSKKVKSPCLRRSRFSVSTCSSSTPECRRASSCSSVTSVTFNPKVDVVVYRRPVEHYASKGWSDFFA